MCLVSNEHDERRENALDSESYSLIKYYEAIKISH